MENIVLSDGQNVIINSFKDCIEVMEDYLGYEFATAANRIYTDKIEECEELSNHESYEKQCMESILEEYQCVMRDVNEELLELIGYIINAKRIDKYKVKEQLLRLHSMILGEL